MNIHKVLAGILICFLPTLATGQKEGAPGTKRHKFTISLGGGPNYYFNNLIRFKKQVNEFNYSFGGRFMWEPEHLLSLGFETGYYRLYNLNLKGTQNTSIRNSAIPFQVVISMRFLKVCYFNFSMGRTLLINDITTDAYGNFDAVTFSLADFASSVGYRRKLNDRFSLNAETKFFYATKAEDRNVALLFMLSYGFK